MITVGLYFKINLRKRAWMGNRRNIYLEMFVGEIYFEKPRKSSNAVRKYIKEDPELNVLCLVQNTVNMFNAVSLHHVELKKVGAINCRICSISVSLKSLLNFVYI